MYLAASWCIFRHLCVHELPDKIEELNVAINCSCFYRWGFFLITRGEELLMLTDGVLFNEERGESAS